MSRGYWMVEVGITAIEVWDLTRVLYNKVKLLSKRGSQKMFNGEGGSSRSPWSNKRGRKKQNRRHQAKKG